MKGNEKIILDTKEKVIAAIKSGERVEIYDINQELVSDKEIQEAFINMDGMVLEKIVRITKEVPSFEHLEMAAKKIMSTMLNVNMSFDDFRRYALYLEELDRSAMEHYGKRIDKSPVYNSEDESIKEFYKYDPEMTLYQREVYQKIIDKDFSDIFDRMTIKQIKKFEDIFTDETEKTLGKSLSQFNAHDLITVVVLKKLMEHEKTKFVLIRTSDKKLMKMINERITGTNQKTRKGEHK